MSIDHGRPVSASGRSVPVWLFLLAVGVAAAGGYTLFDRLSDRLNAAEDTNRQLTARLDDANARADADRATAERARAELVVADGRLAGQATDLAATVAALAKRADAVTHDPNPERGFYQVGDDLLVCYGTKLLPGLVGHTHVRVFDFQFAKEFALRPSVTTGFNLHTNEYVWGVFKVTQHDTKGYAGESFDNKTLAGHATLDVTMSYIAVGKPKAR